MKDYSTLHAAIEDIRAIATAVEDCDDGIISALELVQTIRSLLA